MEFASDGNELLRVGIANDLGYHVLDQELITVSGLNALHFDLHDLPNGIYVLQIESQTKIFTRNIVVMKRD